jgi:hypothetical protein
VCPARHVAVALFAGRMRVIPAADPIVKCSGQSRGIFSCPLVCWLLVVGLLASGDPFANRVATIVPTRIRFRRTRVFLRRPGWPRFVWF